MDGASVIGKTDAYTNIIMDGCIPMHINVKLSLHTIRHPTPRSLYLYTCLSIGKDACIVSTECILQHVSSQLIKNKLLPAEFRVVRINRPETVVERKRLKTTRKQFLLCFCGAKITNLWLLVSSATKGREKGFGNKIQSLKTSALLVIDQNYA